MTESMIPSQRADYSAIVDRPPLKLPGGARMVVWTIVNLEVWDIARPMARQVLPAPTGQPMLPDVPNCFVRTWTRPSSFGEADPSGVS